MLRGREEVPLVLAATAAGFALWLVLGLVLRRYGVISPRTLHVCAIGAGLYVCFLAAYLLWRTRKRM